MKNCVMTVVGNELTIKVDLSQRHGLSGSKKSVTIASTQGNVKIDGTDFVAGINIYSQDKTEIEALMKSVVAETPKEG